MASSSSSSSVSYVYDVFLSFRGEDTRKTFVDHLYTALEQRHIRTYKDDITLPRGESVGPALLKAIQESRHAVIIFSKNYADSSWCLDELVHIMKCRADNGLIVFMLFSIDVDPSHESMVIKKIVVDKFLGELVKFCAESKYVFHGMLFHLVVLPLESLSVPILIEVGGECVGGCERPQPTVSRTTAGQQQDAADHSQAPQADRKAVPTNQKVQKGHYEDLIETWRKTHSRPETGEFKTEKNRNRYVMDMKKDAKNQVRAGVIPYKTDQDILAFPNVISREELDRILRQKDQEAELLRKQTAEVSIFYTMPPNPTRHLSPPAFARPTMPQLSPEWAHLLNPPFPYNQPLQPSYAGPSQYTGPPGYTGTPRYTATIQPLPLTCVGQFPSTPVNNNTFNNCVEELARDKGACGEDNDVRI
ncbi:Toll/interleukin-1 receptor domain-containing protein [Tanacetum coccineum]|uniref:Toll/interleukin-1 receptor domain-containing protein n=1 Tax=Tanacetum coccineum TaxID=301880 RepID=A0ABQ5AID3_9ASTR